MRKDQVHDLYPVLAVDMDTDFVDGAAAAKANVAGNSVDTRGYEGVTFIFATGSCTDADGDRNLSFNIQHSDESGTGWADVPDVHLIGTEAGIAIDGADSAAISKRIRKIGYKGEKRYVRTRISVTAGDAADRVPIMGLAILGCPQDRPVDNPPA